MQNYRQALDFITNVIQTILILLLGLQFLIWSDFVILVVLQIILFLFEFLILIRQNKEGVQESKCHPGQILVFIEIILLIVLGWCSKLDTFYFQIITTFKFRTEHKTYDNHIFKTSIIFIVGLRYAQEFSQTQFQQTSIWLCTSVLGIGFFHQTCIMMILRRSKEEPKRKNIPQLDLSFEKAEDWQRIRQAYSEYIIDNSESKFSGLNRVKTANTIIPEWLEGQNYIVIDQNFCVDYENLLMFDFKNHRNSQKIKSYVQSLLEACYQRCSENLIKTDSRLLNSADSVNLNMKPLMTFAAQSCEIPFTKTIKSALEILFSQLIKSNEIQGQFVSIYDASSSTIRLENTIINLFPIKNPAKGLRKILLWIMEIHKTHDIASGLDPIKEQEVRENEENNPLQNMFGSISHEIGTTLNCILSLSETALSDPSKSCGNFMDLYLQPIRANAQILKFVLNNIRDFHFLLVDQFSIKIECFDILYHIKLCVDCLIQSSDSRNNQLTITVDEDCEYINNDSQKFQQIFYQLLSNATRFTQNGKIEISLSQFMVNQMKAIKITVRDTGIGMKSIQEKKNLQKLLDQTSLFEKISEYSVGCGLGLGISNLIAYKLSGILRQGIQFESEQLVGSTFSFIMLDSPEITLKGNRADYFDSNYYSEDFDQISRQSIYKVKRKSQKRNKKYECSDQDSFSVTQIMDSDDKPKSFIIPTSSVSLQNNVVKYGWRGQCCSRILVVDDEYFNILSLKIILKKYDVILEHAFNGFEALEKAKQRNLNQCKHCGCKGFMLYFLDLNMPLMDGFQTVRQLRQMMQESQLSRGICIANTGYVDLDTKLKCFREGMDFYLSKPLDIKELMAILDKLFK